MQASPGPFRVRDDSRPTSGHRASRLRPQRVTTRRGRRASLALRRGAVAVEFALTSGLLFMILFTSTEFMRVNTIVNTVENAAYEGARAGIVPGAKAQNADTAATAILNAIGIRGAKVTVQPATINEDTPEITVTIDVPLDRNSFVAPRYFLGDTLTKSCTLSREVQATKPLLAGS